MTASNAPDPEEGSRPRAITIEADVATLEKLRKEGRVAGFTVFCDEEAQVGGDHTAPSPLQYFCLSVGF